MEGRMGIFFFILLVGAWACDAKEVVISYQLSSQTTELGLKEDPDVCAKCVEYTAEILDYLNDTKNQNDIIYALHGNCSQLHFFKQQCNKLVDYFAPLFFSELVSIQAGKLCKTFNLCMYSAKIYAQIQENRCDFCKNTVADLMVKLTDPETEVEIMETLMNACNTIEGEPARKCKRMVFKYGPLIFVNVEKFLKTTDICTASHACLASTSLRQEASTEEETLLLSDS